MQLIVAVASHGWRLYVMERRDWQPIVLNKSKNVILVEVQVDREMVQRNVAKVKDSERLLYQNR